LVSAVLQEVLEADVFIFAADANAIVFGNYCGRAPGPETF
jgi:hypothetical protein